MNKKAFSIVAVIAVSTILFMPMSNAALVPEAVNVYAWVDKLQYAPGETGTLYIVVRNDMPTTDVIIKNITITFPWFSYNHATGNWEGNKTIQDIDFTATRKAGKIYDEQVEFTVPTDGRIVSAMTGSIDVDVRDSENRRLTPTWSVSISIDNPPSHIAVEDMEKLLSLITVQVVLTIVCTIIVAAAIFLSRRKAPAMWKKEEPKPASL